jgi:uncharacterized membrane protein
VFQQNKNESEALEKALNGQYDFDIKSLFMRAGEASRKNMATILKCILAAVFFALGITIVFFQIYEIQTVEQFEAIPLETRYLFQMILECLVAPMLVGLTMIGVRTERKEAVTFSMLWAYYPIFIFVASATLMVALLSQLGFALFLLPGIYVLVTTMFVQALVADKAMSPLAALVLSVKVSNKYLVKISLCYLAFFAMFIFVMITFGFALIWVGPLFFNFKGILYNDLFGGISEVQSAPEHSEEETHFDA